MDAGVDITADKIYIQKNNNIDVGSIILTAEVANNMIKRYSELSSEERKTLWDNFGNMSNAQKRDMMGEHAKALLAAAEGLHDEEHKKALTNSATIWNKSKDDFQFAKILIAYFKKGNASTITEEVVENYLKGNQIQDENYMEKSKIVEELKRELQREDIPKDIRDKLLKKIADLETELAEYAQQLKKAGLIYQMSEDKEFLAQHSEIDLNRLTDKELDIYDSYLKNKNPEEYDKLNEEQENVKSELAEYNQQFKKTVSIYKMSKNTEYVPEQEVMQKSNESPIKNEVGDAVFNGSLSGEEISSAILQYVEFLRSFEEEDISVFATMDNDSELIGSIQEFLEEEGMKPELIQYISNLNYNGKLRQTLVSSETRESFLSKLEQTANQKDSRIEGDLTQVFSEYFEEHAVDMDVSAIETARENDLPEVEEEELPEVEEEELPSDVGEEQADLDGNNELDLVDNSFLGKIKRAMANFRYSKQTSSKGFFGRLKDSFQEVFGNPKDIDVLIDSETEPKTSTAQPQNQEEPKTSITQSKNQEGPKTSTTQPQGKVDLFGHIEINEKAVISGMKNESQESVIPKDENARKDIEDEERS